MAVIAGKKLSTTSGLTLRDLQEAEEKKDFSGIMEGRTSVDVRLMLLSLEREAGLIGKTKLSQVRELVDQAFTQLGIAREPGMNPKSRQ